MAETKYGKYFVEDHVVDGKFASMMRFFSGWKFGDVNFSVVWNCISGTYHMENKPHAHDFDQFLFFYGGNSTDIKDFGAEAEFYLGEEGEKHIINKPTIVHVPKGMIHCPLNFTRVDRPVIFMNVALTPEYTRKPEPK